MPRFGSAVSSYGVGRTVVPPVYGGLSSGSTNSLGVKNACTGYELNISFSTTMVDLVTLLEAFKMSIEKFFPSIQVGSMIEGSIAARGAMDPRLFARLEWIRRYKSTYGKFDPQSIDHVNLLKDVFLSLGFDWHMDMWLSNWTPEGAAAAGGS